MDIHIYIYIYYHSDHQVRTMSGVFAHLQPFGFVWKFLASPRFWDNAVYLIVLRFSLDPFPFNKRISKCSEIMKCSQVLPSFTNIFNQTHLSRRFLKARHGAMAQKTRQAAKNAETGGRPTVILAGFTQLERWFLLGTTLLQWDDLGVPPLMESPIFVILYMYNICMIFFMIFLGILGEPTHEWVLFEAAGLFFLWAGPSAEHGQRV